MESEFTSCFPCDEKAGVTSRASSLASVTVYLMTSQPHLASPPRPRWAGGGGAKRSSGCVYDTAMTVHVSGRPNKQERPARRGSRGAASGRQRHQDMHTDHVARNWLTRRRHPPAPAPAPHPQDEPLGRVLAFRREETL